jgi:hypothetical protein
MKNPKAYLRSQNQIRHDVEGYIYKRKSATVIKVKDRRTFKIDTKLDIGFIVVGNSYYKVKKVKSFWYILGEKKPKLSNYDIIKVAIKVHGYFHKYSNNLFRDFDNNNYTSYKDYGVSDLDYKEWKLLQPITDKRANIFETDSEAADRKRIRVKPTDYDPTVYLD